VKHVLYADSIGTARKRHKPDENTSKMIVAHGLEIVREYANLSSAHLHFSTSTYEHLPVLPTPIYHMPSSISVSAANQAKHLAVLVVLLLVRETFT
jgi:hypothetical protein